MPKLDVSKVVLDPMFSERLAVIRTTQTVNTFGRAQLTPTTLTPVGVVNMGPIHPVDIAAEATRNTSIISVHAYNFRFLGPSLTADPDVDTQPDVVLWQGVRYQVSKVYDYSKYGRGFTAAECEAVPLVGAS